jgi:dUTP pyrophosphatase
MNQLKVKFKKLYADTKLPVKGSLDAACFDVYAHSAERDYEGLLTYKLGFSTEIPEGWMAVIVPRSNLSKQKWMLGNSLGIIDSDYRGEWMIKMRAIGHVYGPAPYKVGERVAQVYFQKVVDVEFEEVEELSTTERGEGGFGSTGTK